MKRLGEMFANLRDKQEKALISFVTAGDPALDQLVPILNTLADAGTDAIEIGLPFSDPIADGPTIQASSQRALDRGVTTHAVLDAIRGFDRVPLILMGYLNPMMRMGLPNFAHAAKDAGASATIVCDMIPEEGAAWFAASTDAGLDNVLLAAPTSTSERLMQVVNHAEGFIYAVSRTGVTGAGNQEAPEYVTLVERLRRMTDLPICVGFGIREPQDVRDVCQVADGAVVGSFLVDLIHREWKNGEGSARIHDAVAALKAATRS